MKKAVIYSRVSTQDQDFQSQIEDLQKYAQISNLEVVKTFGEKVSGFDLSAERIEFEAMKEYVFENDIKEVLIWELSRFGRNLVQTMSQIEEFTEKKINIFFRKENIKTISKGAANTMLLQMLSAIAQMENTTIMERFRRGRRAASLKGKATGFTIMPYGYTKDGEGYLMPDEEEAPIVKMCYEMFARGTTLRAIATHFNSLDIHTRNRKLGRKRTIKKGGKEVKVDFVWGYSSIAKILQNPLYKGERFYSEQKIIVPNIVSEELWDKVQAAFAANVGYINRTKYDYLLKNKIICGSCGLGYHTRANKTKRGVYNLYGCNGTDDHAIKCKNGQVASGAIDNSIYSLMLRHREIMLSINKEKQDNFSINEKYKKIAYFGNTIDELNEEKKRLVKVFTKGHIDEKEYDGEEKSLSKEIKKTKIEIKKIEKEIENFKSYEIENIESFKSMALETNFDIKREFINKYVDKVVIHRVDNTDIDFTKVVAWELAIDTHIPKRIHFINPRKNERIKYIELYAFGNPKPMKAVITTVTLLNYSSNNLVFDKGTLSLKKPQ